MNMNASLLLTLSLTVAALAPASAAKPPVASGQRAALLIGNAKYDGFTLPGVRESLDHVEKALAAQQFRIVRHENLNKDGQKSAVEAFARSVPTNGMAFVYYAGLGVHMERNGIQNLLRPVGEKIASDGDYRNAGLNVNEHLLKPLRETSGARVSLVFLDASWESPIKPETDKLKSGMHEFEVGEDAVVMFAAATGETIKAPTDDAASALALALTQHLGVLDQSIEATCKAIEKDLGKPWLIGATQAGIGAPSRFTRVEQPDRGKNAGDAFVNSIGMVFHWCPAGEFTMGSEQADKAATRDRRAVTVKLSEGFWMGECEVTQREYKTVMGKDPPPDFTKHRNAPFFGVTESKNVTEFCKKLTELERKAGTLPDAWEYACPTEAQWEYACRAGSSSAYCFGDSVADLGKYGNFADHALWKLNPDYHWADQRSDDGVGEALAPVGSYLPNAWGLRDMHGNVAELVLDHLLPELPGGTDPAATATKDGRSVIRGGAWCSLPDYCESSFRNSPPSRNKSNFIGFRIVLQPSNK